MAKKGQEFQTYSFELKKQAIEGVDEKIQRARGIWSLGQLRQAQTIHRSGSLCKTVRIGE
jgi:hypothetical protein